MEESDRIYAVIDTNVLVSALLSSHSLTNPFIILESIYKRVIIPAYNEEILAEYKNVLTRPKFHFTEKQIRLVIKSLKEYGIKVEEGKRTDEFFPDRKDVVFYEVKMAVDNSYLVTGNIRHFPIKPFVVTPAQMVEILRSKGLIAD